MGVTGLHQQLKEIQTPKNLSEYKGKTLAVDTYGWLHKAIVSCAQELCQDQPTNKYISSVTKKIEMLRYFGVEPYLVFDGASLPTKAQTANERRLKREEAQRKANQLVNSGNRKLAWKEFMKAAAVTSSMAKSVMLELDRLNVKYVVAPYEADPQMVYLEKIGEVDGILSEDSDLLIFGCKKLITKLNDFGECIEINRENFHKVRSINGLSTFTPEQLRLVAMLSGCDYTKGVPGIGLKTAFNLVKKYNSLDRVLMALRAEGKKTPEDLEDEFLKANLAFQYQKVFDPRTKSLETLNGYPENFSYDMEIVEQCCGLTLDSTIHIGISNGKLHPNTHDVLVSREHDVRGQKHTQFANGKSFVKPETKISNKSTIDKFFNVKSAVKVKDTALTTDKVSVEERESKELNLTEPILEKLSPMHKRSKKTIDIPKDPEVTPKPLGRLSKFFSNSRNSPDETFATPQDHDITGDSEISECSSPVAHIKTSQQKGKVNTDNIIDNITDDDNDDMANVEEGEEVNNEALGSSKESLEKVITASSYKDTAEKLSGDFGLDNEDDEEIEESPVKIKLSNFTKTDKTHFLEDRTDIKRLLRETFLFNPNSKEKFELPPTLKRKLSKPILEPKVFNRQESEDAASSLSSTSSIDLKSDDILNTAPEKENSFGLDANGSQESIKLPSREILRTSSLSKFVYNG